uniref:RNA-dependent RNA polymerase n=1 Tax=Halyomorpha halys partiti-like virus 1 TaxID=3051324 RepID=A0AA49FRR4_9VIRU|nr:MAG: RNA-dependent RNA polymerase [Halyomorpha halys partiti-like virus 1]
MTKSVKAAAADRKVVLTLESDQGFAYSLRPARQDRLAREAASIYFGEENVQKILGTLHRSKISYEALMEDLFEYERPRVRSMREDPSYQMAFQSVRADLTCGLKEKLVPYTTGAVPNLKDFPNSKSPGLPWKLAGYRSKKEVIQVPENVSNNRIMWHHISAGRKVILPDVCLFARPQIAKIDKQKIRAVWGYPLDVYMEEARFFYPIMDYLKSDRHKFPIAYGFEMAHGGMQAVNSMLIRNPDSKFVVLDWSKIDKTIQPWLIRDCFLILSELIDFGKVLDSDGKTWKVREWRSIRRWRYMINYFINTPVRTCKGERFLIKGGVPSGSCFTNLIDSIVNLLVIRYLSYETLGQYPKGELILGDDAAIVVQGTMNLEDWAALALEKFGMVINVSKSYVTTNPRNVHFLGHFNADGIPFKNQDFLIASFIQPEYSRRTAAEAAAAALGQLWTSFDPKYATKWFNIINYIADWDDITLSEVVIHLRNHHFRHKYLGHVGIDATTITIPVPTNEGLVLEVIPPLTCPRQIIDRKYDYLALWRDTQKFWYIEKPLLDEQMEE